MSTTDSQSTVNALRRIIRGTQKSWVLFQNDTCVILMEPGDDLMAQAVEILQEWGPVYAGGAAGDFTVVILNEKMGWIVSSHHQDIFTYVSPDEVEYGAKDITIGLLGRSKRGRDGHELQAIHVEDKRLPVITSPVLNE